MTGPGTTTPRAGWLRPLLLGAGVLFLAAALAVQWGWPAIPSAAAGLGLGLIVAGLARRVAPADGAARWWNSFAGWRAGVASTIAFAALAIIWWAWWWIGPDEAGSAKEIMDSMLALVTAVLGYLFGRGEAEGANKIAGQATSTAAEADEATKRAKVAGDQAVQALQILTAWGAEDPELLKYVNAAQQHIKEAKSGGGES